jgi:hypothetical protein
MRSPYPTPAAQSGRCRGQRSQPSPSGYPRCRKGCHSTGVTGSSTRGTSKSASFHRLTQTPDDASAAQPGQAGSTAGSFRRGGRPGCERLVQEPDRAHSRSGPGHGTRLVESRTAPELAAALWRQHGRCSWRLSAPALGRRLPQWGSALARTPRAWLYRRSEHRAGLAPSAASRHTSVCWSDAGMENPKRPAGSMAGCRRC